MTKLKKTMRLFLVFVLTFVMAITVASVPAAAAGGVETWYSSYQYDPFIVNPYNLTPVKTIGTAGRLYITAQFDIADNGLNNVDCTLQIRNTAGQVLASQQFFTMRRVTLSCSVDVQVGQQVQIYMSVYDRVTGENRYASVSYSYRIR